MQPGYSEVPLTSGRMVDEWLKFFNMSAPLTCVGYLISHDPVTLWTWCRTNVALDWLNAFLFTDSHS